MVSCTIIGGLGNSLFQISMLLAFSLKHNLEYCIPLEITYPHSPEQKQFHSANLNYCDKPNTLPLYLEEGFTYKEIPYMDNVSFQGYWQSWKYFSDYRDEILKALDFKYEPRYKWVAIHVRRADYLLYPTMHPVVTQEYIEKAIQYFVDRGYNNFRFFSDDLDWCKMLLNHSEFGAKFSKLLFAFSEKRNEIEDLCVMSSHEHQIGSNSSFSWWAYYLNQNENKIGVFPKKWFGADMPHDTKDLFMPKMILL